MADESSPLSITRFIGGWERGKAFWQQQFGQLRFRYKALLGTLVGGTILAVATGIVETILAVIDGVLLVYRVLGSLLGRAATCLLGTTCRPLGAGDVDAVQAAEPRPGGLELLRRLFAESAAALPSGPVAFGVGVGIAVGVVVVASLILRVVT